LNRRLLRIVALVGCGVAGLPLSATAQVPSGGTDPSAASVRVGVLSLAPRFSVRQIGVDTNVFNTVDNPQRDATATASTGTDLWLRTGRGMLMVSGDTEYVHYDRFGSERSLSSRAQATYEVRFNRIRPVVRAATRDLKQRPNDEITARVRQYGTDFGAGIDFRVLSRSTMRVEWRHEVSGFFDTAVFDGQQLRTQLSHRVEAVDATWRQQVTPLTTFVAKVSRDRTTFDFEGTRNSENYRLNGGFELSQFALIRGTVLVGYHELRADNPVVLPEFSGVTAAGDVSYTAPTQTRIQVTVNRELRNSYDPRTPHYTQQAWGATITQRVFGRWDLQLNGGRAEQDYLAVAGTGARTDRVDRIGGGVGFALARQVRAGLDITSVNRLSEMPGRDYSGVLGGLSLTYGY
jgi:hypothetical protein